MLIAKVTLKRIPQKKSENFLKRKKMTVKHKDVVIWADFPFNFHQNVKKIKNKFHTVTVEVVLNRISNKTC